MKIAAELINEAEAAAAAFARENSDSRIADIRAFEVGWLQESLLQLEMEAKLALARKDAEIERLRMDMRLREAEDAWFRLDHIERQLDERDRARYINATLGGVL